MTFFDNPHTPHNLSRQAVYAKNGMVGTTQPLAAQAGLTILQKGGNAIDAAIATAAALTVVEPTSNGLGGDAFAIVYSKGKLHGLNASGKSPESISIDAMHQRGKSEMPVYGFDPVTVPGEISGWVEMSRKFGKLPFKELLEPAIELAENGFPLSPVVAHFYQVAADKFSKLLPEMPFLKEWFDTFVPSDVVPKTGDIVYLKNHAKTLREIAETEGESFYRGRLAELIAEESRKQNGFLNLDDLHNHKAEWVQPLSVNYRGFDVWELPPNGQGIVALEALAILNRFKMPDAPNESSTHLQIEALKLAFADAEKYVTDLDAMPFDPEELLADDFISSRKELITNRAEVPEAGDPYSGGTVYLATADNEGNMVSFIQSNYMGFGSGVVIPGTGITMQNRGHNFSMDQNHHNALAGGKRSYHTIIPGFLTKNGQAVGPFGVMGGFMQPQGHIQVIANTIDYQLNPQAALDMPRYQWIKENTVQVENHFPTDVAKSLKARGHNIDIALEHYGFGRGQIIWRHPETGVYVGGTESRADGVIIGY